MPGSTWYPPADTKAQRRDGYGGSKNLTGVTMTSISKVVLHSTETAGWPGYPDFAPTLTYDPWKHQWRQHMPLNRSATTLADPSSTAVRENRDNVVQVEIVGYCDPARWPKYGKNVEQVDDEALADLGAFLAFMHAEWQLPLSAVANWVSYPKSYGAKASQRLTGPQYDAFKGVLGHQHVSGNDHGDPGRLPITAIIRAAATGATAPPPVVPARPTTPSVDAPATEGPAPEPAPVDPYAAKLASWGFANARDYQSWLWNQPIADCDGVLGPKEKAFLDTEDDTKYGTAILKGYPVNYPYGAGNVAGAAAYVLGIHAGDDHATNGKTGVPVHSPRSGTVAKVAYDPGGWGNYVEIDYIGSDRRARFCHLATTTVKAGATVKFNQVIGTAGATGNVTGIHCHYQEEVAPYWQGSPTVAAKKRVVVRPFFNRSPLADYGDGASPAKPAPELAPAPASTSEKPVVDDPAGVEPAPEPPTEPTPAPIPPQEPSVPTRIRVATYNVLSDAAGIAGGEGSFASRIDRIIDALRASKASILLLQECNADRAADIQGRLGAGWVWSRANSRVVMVDKTVWKMGDERVRSMPTPYSKGNKDWPLVQLTHKNGDVIWAASVHFSSTSPYKKIATSAQMSEERKRQAESVIADLQDYHWVVGGGDHNSSSFSAGKPKAVLLAAGYQLLTKDKTFDSANVDSFPNSTPGGQQIDEIWCKGGLDITDGAIISSKGSDHNLMVAELTIDKRG